MYRFDLAPRSASLLLRAMRPVALADGEETAQGRALLEVARDAFGLADAIDRFAPFDLDDDLASGGTLDDAERERLVQSMLRSPAKVRSERAACGTTIPVVGGCDVDPKGESEIVAFMAGSRKDQVGLRISAFAPGVPNVVDAREYMRHSARGSKVTCDLSSDRDFRADFESDREDVRKRFNMMPTF